MHARRRHAQGLRRFERAQRRREPGDIAPELVVPLSSQLIFHVHGPLSGSLNFALRVSGLIATAPFA